MLDVFISYKSARRPAAEHLARVVEMHGYSVWFDYGLIPGRDFSRQIENKLREAKVCIVLWCNLSVTSEWVLEEAHVAKESGKILPVWLEPAELPLGFTRLDTIDLSLWDGNPRSHLLNRFWDMLEARIGREPDPQMKALRAYEDTWRRFGAPTLAKFALDRAAPEKGYVPERPKPADAAPVVTSIPAHHPAMPRTRALWLAGAALAVVVLAAGAALVKREPPSASTGPAATLAAAAPSQIASAETAASAERARQAAATALEQRDKAAAEERARLAEAAALARADAVAAAAREQERLRLAAEQAAREQAVAAETARKQATEAEAARAEAAAAEQIRLATAEETTRLATVAAEAASQQRERESRIVEPDRVQTALAAKGCYAGPIDNTASLGLKTALARFISTANLSIPEAPLTQGLLDQIGAAPAQTCVPVATPQPTVTAPASPTRQHLRRPPVATARQPAAAPARIKPKPAGGGAGQKCFYSYGQRFCG